MNHLLAVMMCKLWLQLEETEEISEFDPLIKFELYSVESCHYGTPIGMKLVNVLRIFISRHSQYIR